MQRLLYFFLLLLPVCSFADGNNTLGQSYTYTACGLGYTTVSHVLGKRFSPPGADQPAAFVISDIPACAKIEKAFLYVDASGNGDPQTPVITGPNLLAPSYPMTIIGTAPDKCWGYAKTISYRADITPVVTGNGTYTINGLSTDNLTDVDGATILVIYSDLSVPWQGTIILDDGAKEGQGLLAYTMPHSISCSTLIRERAFMIAGDIDENGNAVINGHAVNSTDKYWSYYETDASIPANQTTSSFSISSVNDCYNIVVTGLYYQSSCTACSVVPPVQLSASSTGSHCDSCNGTAHVNATGGSGTYTYSWAPSGGNTADATGLCAGVYTVTVQSDCGHANTTVTIPNIATARTFSLGQDLVICSDSTVILKPDDTSAGGYQWNTGATTSSIKVSNPGTYWLHQGGACGTTDSINVTMVACDTQACLYFPNAFTPNNDGLNDRFGPVSGCNKPISFYQLRIYDRWCRMIFESGDINYKWDGTYKGTPQDIGVYFYHLKYGINSRELKGNFTLVK